MLEGVYKSVAPLTLHRAFNRGPQSRGLEVTLLGAYVFPSNVVQEAEPLSLGLISLELFRKPVRAFGMLPSSEGRS